MLEAEVLQRVRAIFDQIADPADLLVANGDDGAVIAAGNRNLVLSTDMAVEGVHFNLQWSNADQIGRKITAANLADICAMGGWPKYLLVSVSFPKSFLPHLEELAKGIFEESKKVGAKVVGGDISSGEQLVISITAIGESRRSLTRAGARLHDLVMVSNLPGWSAAGLRLLQTAAINEEISKKAIAQHLTPELDYRKYQTAFEAANSATDISDGLLLDALNIADSSKLGIRLESELISQAADYIQMQQLGEAYNFVAGLFGSQAAKSKTLQSVAMEWVLTGGEDHALLVTAPEQIPGYLVIGRVIAESGIWLDEQRFRAGEMGFQHHW